MSGGTYPQLVCEVAFTTNPYDAVPNYQDISADLDGGTQLGIRRLGRQRALDRFEAGTATIPLDDESRAYDPTNTAGSHYPNVLPGNKVRLSAIYNSITYRLFTGYAEGWPPKWRLDLSTTNLSATDALGLLAQEQLISPYGMEVLTDAPLLWYRFQEAAGAAVALDSSGNGRGGVYRGGVTFGGAGAAAVNDTTASSITLDGTTGYVTGPFAISGAAPFTIECWFKTTASSGNFLLTATPSNIAISVPVGGVVFSGVGTCSAGGTTTDGNWHQVVCGRDALGNSFVYVDGVLGGTNAAGISLPTGMTLSVGAPPPPLMWAGSVGEVELYPIALPASRIAAHYAAGVSARSGDLTGARLGWLLDRITWAAGERLIDTGRGNLSAAGDLATDLGLGHAQAVGDTEGGSFYVMADGRLRFRQRFSLPSAAVATFTDQVGLNYDDVTPAHDRIPLKNYAKVSRRGGATAQAIHPASRSRYRTSPANLEVRTLTDQGAADVANWIVSTYHDPQLQIRVIELEPGTDDNLWPQVLGREIEDVIQFIGTPPGGGSPISQPMVIQGIEHDIGPGKQWKTRWWLAPLVNFVCMTYNDAVLGFWGPGVYNGFTPRWGY